MNDLIVSKSSGSG